jgi:hypothetical protein
MTACVARPNARNSIDLVLIGTDRSHRAPERNFSPIPYITSTGTGQDNRLVRYPRWKIPAIDGGRTITYI